MKLKNILLATAVLATALFTQSCMKDDNVNYIFPNAVVTVKPFNDQTFIMQLDDSTTLKATNITTSPFKEKKVRALVCIEEEDLKAIINDKDRTSETKQYDVKINYIDSITTKALAPNLGEQNIEKYGNDPLEIIRSFETVVEDGYLTIRFRTYWGMQKHIFNLVQDSTNPYKVTLYQNSQNDYNNMVGDGIVAFDLSSLPDTEGKNVALTLAWQSFTGPKTTTFKYKTIK